VRVLYYGLRSDCVIRHESIFPLILVDNEHHSSLNPCAKSESGHNLLFDLEAFGWLLALNSDRGQGQTVMA